MEYCCKYLGYTSVNFSLRAEENLREFMWYVMLQNKLGQIAIIELLELKLFAI